MNDELNQRFLNRSREIRERLYQLFERKGKSVAHEVLPYWWPRDVTKTSRLEVAMHEAHHRRLDVDKLKTINEWRN